MDDKIAKKLEDFFAPYKKQKYKKGEILIRADEDPTGVLYLTEGLVKKYAISSKGEEIVVNMFKPISFFPMSWALNRSKNEYYYEAVLPTEVVKASADDVIGFLRHEPDVLLDLMERVYRGTDGMLMRMVYLMSGSAYTRLLTELIIVAKRFGKKDEKTGVITFSTTEKDLAAQAGMTRETVSRELRRIKDKQLLTLQKNVFSIPDLALLQRELSEEF